MAKCDRQFSLNYCLISVILPAMPSQKRAAAAAKKKFSAATHSDHMAVLRAFQVINTTNNKQDTFIVDYYVECLNPASNISRRQANCQYPTPTLQVI